MKQSPIRKLKNANGIGICCELLKERELSIAFAESATAGHVMAEFSLVESAGQFLKGGVVCYDAVIKEELLKVPKALISTYTAESAEVTYSLSLGLQHLINADIYVAITGLTSPGGSESEKKPVGTMFFHFLYKDSSKAYREVFKGDSENVMFKSVEFIAEKLSFLLMNEWR